MLSLYDLDAFYEINRSIENSKKKVEHKVDDSVVEENSTTESEKLILMTDITKI